MMDIGTVTSDLMDNEGFSAKPYKDSVGVWTIGYGWNLESTPITPEAAEFILKEHVLDAVANAERYEWFHELSYNRKRVVVNMIFNLGRTGFARFTKTIAYLSGRDYQAASLEMLDSLWAKQVGTRANFLSGLMLMG